MNLSSNAQLRSTFYQLLRDMTNLSSLAISGARIDGHLESIVTSIGSGRLIDLSLKWCCVTAADLSQLGSSQYCANLTTVDLSFVHPPCEMQSPESTFCETSYGSSYNDSGLSSDWSAHMSNGYVTAAIIADGTDATSSTSTIIAEETDTNMNCDVSTFANTGVQSDNTMGTFTTGDSFQASNDLVVLLMVFVQQLHQIQNLRTLRLANRLSCRESTLIVDILEEKVPVLQLLEWLDIRGLALSVDCTMRLVTAFAKQDKAQLLSASLSHDVHLPTYVDKGQFWTRLHNAKQGKNLKVVLDNFATLDYFYNSPETLRVDNED